MRAIRAALLVSLLAPSALANGRLPSAGQIAIDLEDPANVLVRTTFGVLLSRDHGAHFRWICEDAMHYGGAQDPPYAFTRGGGIALVSSNGFVRGDGERFEPNVPLRGARDLSIDTRADRGWVLTSMFEQQTDAGAYRFQSTLIRTDASARLDPRAAEELPGDVWFETVDNVPGDARKVALSAASHDAMRHDAGYLFVSDDGAEHWHRLAAPLMPPENSLYIASMSNAGDVLVRTYATPTTPSRLLYASFAALMAAARRGAAEAPLTPWLTHDSALFGVTIAADGAVFAGGNGVWWAPRVGAPFEKVGDARVRCLLARGDELWACNDEVSGVLAMVSRDGGRSFTPVVRVADVLSMQHDASCAREWVQLEAELGTIVAPQTNMSAGEERWRRWWWLPPLALVLTVLVSILRRRRADQMV